MVFFSYLKSGILTRESVGTDTTFGAGYKRKCSFGFCLFASFPPIQLCRVFVEEV